MRNRNKGNGLIVAALVGLLLVAGVGAWLLIGQDSKPVSKVVKPTTELGK